IRRLAGLLFVQTRLDRVYRVAVSSSPRVSDAEMSSAKVLERINDRLNSMLRADPSDPYSEVVDRSWIGHAVTAADRADTVRLVPGNVDRYAVDVADLVIVHAISVSPSACRQLPVQSELSCGRFHRSRGRLFDHPQRSLLRGAFLRDAHSCSDQFQPICTQSVNLEVYERVVCTYDRTFADILCSMPL